MMPQAPIAKSLVLVGGGHAHVHVLKSFGMRPHPGVRLTLITRDVETPYSGMIPGFVAGHYSFDECHVDLHRLARFASARLVHDRAVGLDRTERRVLLHNSAPVAYDVLSIDIGSEPTRAVPGADRHVTPAKPISTLATRWNALLQRARSHRGRLHVVVVGGGAGGCELVLAMRHALQELARDTGQAFEPAFTLVSRDKLLAQQAPAAGRLLQEAMRVRGIETLTGAAVEAVEPQGLVLADGRRIDADEIIWVTQAGAAPWLRETGITLDAQGFIAVGADLRSVDDPSIFAAGDIAAVLPHPRPKAGVFAVRQGPPLADNLRRVLNGEEPQAFRPQGRYLALIGTGDGEAIATRGNWAARGRWAWRLKDWIDRRWMRGYRDLRMQGGMGPTPPSASTEGVDAELRKVLSEATMRCGGCGAKVGASALSRVLARLDRSSASGVVMGLDSPDDAAIVEVPPGRVLAQSVDFFRALVDDPYVLGRIAANHALGDLYAMGAVPHSALAVATVPYAAERVVEDDLFRLLAGAQRALGEAGVTLIGGHSAEAAELALGFSVNGFAVPTDLWRKSGLRAGHALVLTKPLGTGVVFAGAMRGGARASWIEAATRSMLLSNAAAVPVLRAHGVTACTDVTGFGLIGHLVEMMKASGVAASLDLGAVLVLPGALEMFANGQQSSLQLDNLRAGHVIANRAAVAGDARLPILFDPQTAGGLLAGLPAEHAGACVVALREAGYAEAAVVGRVSAADEAGAVVKIVN